MTMPRCETCNWWVRFHDTKRPIGQCQYATNGHDGQKVMVVAEGEKVWHEMLLTEPEFGCVEHELREDAQ